MRLMGRRNEAERVLTAMFASDPGVVEAVLMIRATPLSGLETQVVWRSFGTHWQIDVQERNLKKRQVPVAHRSKVVSGVLFR